MGESGLEDPRIEQTRAVSPRWRPVLCGALARRAGDAIADILAELERWPLDDPGLAGGLAGHALGYEYLARALGERALDERARRAWESAAAAVETSVSAPWLFGGFPGIAWVGAHLAPRLFPSPSADPLGEIDSALLSFLAPPNRFAGLDLVSGVAGLAVYGLERLPGKAGRRILERVVGRLEEAAAPVAGPRGRPGQAGRAWLTPAELLPPHQRSVAPRGYFNLGVAHGMPAIVALLAAIAAAGIERERAGRLADDGLAWIWAQESRLPGETRFPAWIAVGDEYSRPSRVAWCYGDLGVSLALLLAARARGTSGLAARATRLARHAAGITGARSGVRDAGLCHGSAGNALLFARLAHLTGCQVLADAARHWAEHTLTHRRADPVAGFPAWRARDPVAGRGFGHLPDASVLTGAMGVAMALAALISEEEPAWDRFLVASLAI